MTYLVCIFKKILVIAKWLMAEGTTQEQTQESYLGDYLKNSGEK